VADPDPHLSDAAVQADGQTNAAERAAQMTVNWWSRYLIVGSFCVLGLILLSQLYIFFVVSALIAPLPFELDYGEGIVWQQALRIFKPDAYGPIDQFPAIVFHYPPVYHFTTRAIAFLFNCDMLLAGRLISRGATVAMILFTAVVISQAASSRSWRYFAVAGLVGLLLPTITAIDHWSRLMRVDMLAFALSLAGLAFGLRAYARPRWIYAAAACFVAGVFTKQTSLPAPAALFAVMLWLRPQTAIKGMATCVIASLIILIGGSLLTGGGFFRHLLLYNVNRVDWFRINLAINEIRNEGLLVGTGVIALTVVFVGVAKQLSAGRSQGRTIRSVLIGDDSCSARVTLLVYGFIGALTPLMIIKIGSNVNYMIEFFVTVTLLIGAALIIIVERVVNHNSKSRDLVGLAFGMMLSCMLIVHAAQYKTKWPTQRYIANQQKVHNTLVAMMKSATKPIIADPMVALLRAGKPVLWESAIFAELGSMGTWDQRPFLGMIANHDFAMFVTDGYGGERYPSPIAEAIAADYPIKRRIGQWVVHTPRSQIALPKQAKP
jgi:hypothetical protein